MSGSRRAIVLGASGTVVAGAIAAGLIFLGSPAEERERRIDDRRVADLHGIAAAVNLHWSRDARLPAALDELVTEPGLGINTRDPATSEVYEYRVLDGVRYEVCATFDAESGTGAGASSMASPAEAGCQGCHALLRPTTAGRVGGPVAARFDLRSVWAHRAGRQCYELRASAGPSPRFVDPAVPGGSGLSGASPPGPGVRD